MKARDYLETALRGCFSGLGQSWPATASVEPPKDRQFGDLTTNAAMIVAGQNKTNPRELAQKVRTALLAACPELTSVEVAGPGFLNVTFADSFWQRTIRDVLDQGAAYGRTQLGQNRKVMVEYVSANPTGPLHIGHGRGAALGDSLARIMRATGHEAMTEYYINDAGKQMNILGNSVLCRLRQRHGSNEAFPEDHYQGDYIVKIAEELEAKHGPALLDDQKALEICREFASATILAGIKTDLAAFKVEHENWYSEKAMVASGLVGQTLDELLAKGLAYQQDGALWFKTTEFGDDKDRVLRKSDGSLTYFASDIAYHADKFKRGTDLAVDIWGADHHGYVARMKAAVQAALGRDTAALEVILVQLVTLLRDGAQVAMSTRAGEFVTLREVLDEVGPDAARFMFLSRKSDSPLDFDLDLMKRRSMDNPVYYVQYAHARIHSLLGKAAEQGFSLAEEPSDSILAHLRTEEDLDLLRRLEMFPDTLNLAASTLSPHHLSYYLMDLAGSLHRYYTVHQILAAPEEDLIKARLLLFRAVGQVIANGLELLGVSAPEHM